MWPRLVAQIIFLLAKHYSKGLGMTICKFVFSTSSPPPKYSVQSSCRPVVLVGTAKFPLHQENAPWLLFGEYPSLSQPKCTQVTQAWCHCGLFSLLPFTHSHWSGCHMTKAGWTKANSRHFSGITGKKGVGLPSKAGKLETTWEWSLHREKQSGEMEGKGSQVIYWGQQLVFPRLFSYMSQ